MAMINEQNHSVSNSSASAPTLVTLREAIVSLYQDQIRPTQADISRRMTEMGCRNITLGEMMDLACDSLSEFGIVVDDGLQISIELKEEPVWFCGWIDPVDSALTYSVEIWDLFNHFVAHACRSVRPYQVKGGRYGLAKRLQDELRHPNDSCLDCSLFRSAIQTFTVGRLSHLVQHAIQRGVFRYEDNWLQPSACCKVPSAALAAKLMKDDAFSLPPRAVPKNTIPVTREVETLEELHSCLTALLSVSGRLPLSQLKSKMISEFEVLLNPIKFGFTKLSELLKDMDGFTLQGSQANTVYLIAQRSYSTASNASTTY